MNRQIKIFSLLALTCVHYGPSLVLAADDAELERVRDQVTDMFQSIERESIRTAPIDGWYAIQQGSVVAYVSEDVRYLLQGDIIDLETRANLTETARNDMRRELMAMLDESQVITFTPEEKQHSVTVFTDVECTYCRRLHAQIDDYLEQGIEVRYLLYPRNGPASRSWTTSEQVWCASDRNGALTAAKTDQEFESVDCDATIVQNHYVLGQEVGLSGTPAIILEDGTLIGGYMPPNQLASRLNRQTEKAASASDNPAH